ncbi:MAG: cyclic nucleotide-binding domain-containing protein [Aggregatilineales bacterium]
MADPFIVAHLTSLPSFSQLNAEQANRVADAAQVRQYAVGDLVFQQGQPARGMVKLINGQARLWQLDGQRQQQLVGTIAANQYLNEVALVRPSLEGGTLQIIEAAVVMLIDRDKLLTVLAQRPDIRAAIPLTFEGVPTIQPDANAHPSAGISGLPERRLPNTDNFTGDDGMSDSQKLYPSPAMHRNQHLTTPQTPIQQQQMRQNNPPQMPYESPIGAMQTGDPEQMMPVAPMTKKAFRAQRDDEELLIDTRRHWWSYMRKIWFPTLIAGAIFALSSLIPFSLALPLDAIAVVLFGTIMLYFYLEWQNDHLIVTSQRVLHIERIITTFQQSISQVPMASIQEVNAEDFTNDPFSRLFRFGKVEIKTPGDSGNISFNVVPNPQRIQKLIFAYRDEARKKQDARHVDEVRAVIDRVVTGNEAMPGLDAPVTTIVPHQRKTWLGWTRSVNEEGAITYRKHWFFWMRQVFLPAIAVFASLIFIVVSLFIPALNSIGLLAPMFGFLLFLVSAIWLYWMDWDWRHDMYIIGDDTVQLIHKRPLWLQSETDQIFLNRIDNVVSDKSGIFQSVFDYGDVRLALVGADKGDAKVFKYVPNPEEVQSEITKRQEAIRRRAQLQQEQQRKEEIAEYLRVYHETTGGGVQNVGTNYTQDSYQQNDPRRDNMRPPNVPRT